MLRTVLLGCAPLLIQCLARSRFTVKLFSAFFGLYVPMFSMNRPSRGLRPSATTIRYTGTFFVPTRRNRILTGTVVTPLPGQPRQRAFACHLFLQLAHVFHHSLHLIELLEQIVDFRHARPAAARDARAPARVQEFRT